MDINPAIFKAYDIRGVVPGEMNPEIGYRVGRAFVAFVRKRYGAARPKIILSRDVRISSPEIAKETCRGLVEAGAEVIDAGITTSPMHYWIIGSEGADGGIVVTASHNPKEFNGLKITGKGVEPLGAEDGLNEIRYLANDNQRITNNKPGTVQEKNYLDTYVWSLDRDFSLGAARDKSLGVPRPGSGHVARDESLGAIKVVADASNGAVGLVLPRLFAPFPRVTLIPLYFEPDGNFPNHEPNPLKEEVCRDLAARVVREHADLGVIFDGDGDRVFFLDEQGRRIPGDIMTAVIASHILASSLGSAVIYSAPSSRIVRETIESAGGKAVMSRTGHYFIKRAMRTHDAVFGGEHSGHFYFEQTCYAENSMLAMLEILALLSSKKVRLSELVKPFERYVTSGEINFPAGEWGALKERVIREFPSARMDETDGLTINLPDWRFNLRQSNTEHLTRLNIEAKDQATLDDAVRRLSKLIETS